MQKLIYDAVLDRLGPEAVKPGPALRLCGSPASKARITRNHCLELDGHNCSISHDGATGTDLMHEFP
jgi:hypothetical protein